MEKMHFAALACTAAVLSVIGQTASAAPIGSSELSISAVLNVGVDTNSNSSLTPYNPRSVGGQNYALTIGTPGFARYPAGSGVASVTSNASSTGNPVENRMILPFRGANSSTYVLGAGGSVGANFQRLDYGTLDNPASYTGGGLLPTSFDWVDDDTIVFASDAASPNRKSVFIADVVANPFSVTVTNTYTEASATRFRNVRVGDVYNGYAYVGDALGSGTGPSKFWAVDLSTGAYTLLGSVNVTTPLGGSAGLWTVKEVGGYLYVHTTDDGINVYSMTNATTLGSLVEDYTKAEINALLAGVGITGNQNWGFDVVDGGARMLLTAGPGQVVEIIPEPASLGLLGLAGLAMIRRRK